MAARRGAVDASGAAPGWKVSYTLGGRRRTVRRFRTETRARKFYVSLFRRANPPHEQAIEPDGAAGGAPERE